MSDITHRLRCKYPLGPIQENGEPEFGWRDFSGPIETILPTSLMLEAADHIDFQSAEIERLREALSDVLRVMEQHEQLGGCASIYGDNARAALAQQTAGKPTRINKCITCQGVGIVGHSEICPECKRRPIGRTNMTNKFDDAGPAYPTTIENQPGEHGRKGMSLHDVFLLAVVQGEIAASAGHSRPGTTDLVNYAFHVADAMIAERNKRRGE